MVGDGRQLPRLHVVTDDEVLVSGAWLSQATAVLTAGGPALALHLRGPNTGARRLLQMVDSLAPVAQRAGAALFVNDRVDVARVTEVDGVHLAGRSLGVTATRELVGLDRWIGVSCHDLAAVRAAVAEGADYVFLGTIYETETHPGRKGVGADGVEEACEGSRGARLVAIGGIEPAQASDLMAAGAYGVAAIRGIWSAEDPAVAVRQYLDRLEDRPGDSLGSHGHDSDSPER